MGGVCLVPWSVIPVTSIVGGALLSTGFSDRRSAAGLLQQATVRPPKHREGQLSIGLVSRAVSGWARFGSVGIGFMQAMRGVVHADAVARSC